MPADGRGLAGRLAAAFLGSKLTPLLVVASIALGLFAVALTAREEEPQIVVPMVDVLAPLPGADAVEVESQLTTPLERRLWGIPGVEYVYSTSRRDAALVTVRFKVNEPLEASLVKVRQEIDAHPEILPAGAVRPTVRLLTIDDVPFLTLTLHGGELPAGVLRQLAEEVAREIAQVPEAAQVQVLGGARRVVRVEPDPQRLRSFGVSLAEVQQAVQRAEAQLPAGELVSPGARVALRGEGFVRRGAELRRLAVATRGGQPVLLEDLAEVKDGPEPEPAVILTASRQHPELEQAVTIAVAKRTGTNATALAKRIARRTEALRGGLIPSRVQVEVTRNYGETAAEKSNELIEHLLIATLSVIALIGLAMGWRSAAVVGVAVPVTLALTLLLTWLFGYTLNRVTLFALIFSIGILVDDAIVVVENIVRHFRLPSSRGRSLVNVAVEAVDEVGNPTILATFAVIGAILPMAFVRGLMGPYMRPIPVGASAAMVFSLIVAFVVSPWAALRLLRHYAREGGREHHETEGWTTRLYRKLMNPLVLDAKRRWMFLGGVVFLLLAALAFVPMKWVRVKMLPFDNKSEFQVIIDMPDGTPLEQTTRVAQALGQYLAQQPEVTNYQIYSGTSGPYNFNGLVRHYSLRRLPNQADIQVNLLSRHDRKAQSHEIARRFRPELVKLAQPFGARIKVAEVPPGPPVLETLVAEVYGPDYQGQIQLASQIKQVFQQTAGVVDVDWYVEDPQTKYDLKVDLDKASLHGLSAADVTRTLQIGLAGADAGLLHDPQSREDIPIRVRLSRADRSGMQDLANLKLPTPSGSQIALQEVTTLNQTTIDTSVYRKNLQPVVYVTGDVAGEEESPVYAIGKMSDAIDKLKLPDGYSVKQYKGTTLPERTDRYSMKWDGEWHITVEVFRDLGLAFAAVLVLIYVLVVGWFRSFLTPLVIMAPIPLTLVGILPAHAMMGAFFTATSMIGFIAGAGIIVRNSIILVDFIELRRSQGMSLEDAVVDAGAVRFRPMLLTAAAVVVGASVILFDPIFQGLALSLMAGEVASTVLSRMAVPVLYYVSQKRKQSPPLHPHSPENIAECEVPQCEVVQ